VRDDVLKHWLPSRTAHLLTELRAAGLYPVLDSPTLNQQGGPIQNGFRVQFTGPTRGAIYFTMDGSDPRLPGGAVAPSAKKYARSGSVPLETETLPVITRNTVLKCRTLDGNQWSALNESFFQIAPNALNPGEVAITKRQFSPPAGDDGA